LTHLTPSMLHFWAYEHDQHARDEMIKLHPKRDQVVTVTIQDLNLDPPSSFSHSDHDDYLHQLRNTLYSRAIERQEFNFHLSEFRTTRFGGAKIQELNSSPSAASSDDSSGIVTHGGCGSSSGSGMAIGLNWRMPRAVSVRLPRDIAMAARLIMWLLFCADNNYFLTICSLLSCANCSKSIIHHSSSQLNSNLYSNILESFLLHFHLVF
jgi:hypothetical protein